MKNLLAQTKRIFKQQNHLQDRPIISLQTTHCKKQHQHQAPSHHLKQSKLNPSVTVTTTLTTCNKTAWENNSKCDITDCCLDNNNYHCYRNKNTLLWDDKTDATDTYSLNGTDKSGFESCRSISRSPGSLSTTSTLSIISLSPKHKEKTGNMSKIVKQEKQENQENEKNGWQSGAVLSRIRIQDKNVMKMNKKFVDCNDYFLSKMICLTQRLQKENEWYIRISSIKQCTNARKIVNVLINNWLRVFTNENIIKTIDNQFCYFSDNNDNNNNKEKLYLLNIITKIKTDAIKFINYYQFNLEKGKNIYTTLHLKNENINNIRRILNKRMNKNENNYNNEFGYDILKLNLRLDMLKQCILHCNKSTDHLNNINNINNNNTDSIEDGSDNSVSYNDKENENKKQHNNYTKEKTIYDKQKEKEKICSMIVNINDEIWFNKMKSIKTNVTNNNNNRSGRGCDIRLPCNKRARRIPKKIQNALNHL